MKKWQCENCGYESDDTDDFDKHIKDSKHMDYTLTFIGYKRNLKD